jgi:hypothetical protein
MKPITRRLLFLLIVLIGAPLFTFADNYSEKALLELREPQPTMIESLEDGESYSIEITSIGCFNGTRQTVIISKNVDVITASLQDSSKILTSSDIETFRSFEIQLRALERGGCSTVDTYVLRYGNETFKTSDGTCSWHGYRKLLEMFS